ncbi:MULTISPECIES: YlbF family regulator [unclassified Bacillus cereus group]|uniref:YlbF family regulator n=1 Tax=unclassified Bacillus cereus group TaxID=2750818 RepID=UPI001F5801E2|nr:MULTISPECIES: YlbF family regulator [unclassified Bacillus cereus group]
MIVATLESVLILDKAEQLAQAVVYSDIAENYRKCFKDLQEDSEAQELIRQFAAMKERYEEVRRFGKYHPDYAFVSTKMRELKRSVDLHDKIAAFKKAESNLQKLLDEVSVAIGSEVSSAIKVPTGNPFFDAGGCGGGCGSGGSCGCKKTG